MTRRQTVLLSPLLIIAVNLSVAVGVGQLVGKWVFVPMILTGWLLWGFFIVRYGGPTALTRWLQRPQGSWGWSVLAILVGLIPLPLFLFHADTLSHWTVWLPWICLALINPWIEEFYWRGLLLDYASKWPAWVAVLYSSTFFALNHAAFGLHSEINSGYDVVISTFVMGIVWGVVYLKTKSLRWAIASHFLVDFFNLSAAAFLDLWEKGTW